MIIKIFKGNNLYFDINNIKNIFDLKCLVAKNLNIKYMDIRLFLNGKEIENNTYISNLNTNYLIGVKINSNMGMKVKKLII